jgi:hypothetical protein
MNQGISPKWEDESLRVWQLRQEGHSFWAVARIMGLSKSTVWRRWWLRYYLLKAEGVPFLIAAKGWSRAMKSNPAAYEPRSPIYGRQKIPAPRKAGPENAALSTVAEGLAEWVRAGMPDVPAQPRLRDYLAGREPRQPRGNV